MKVLEFELTNPLIPADLPRAVKAATDALPAGGREGVVISGRGPVWLFAALTHEYHPRPFVATYDPRLGGGVVVESHTPDRKVGEVVALDEAEVVKVAL